ncbi:uncharacterized protein C2orf42 [Anopheles nili]|uniref:uncharacterized protein C2orf42 n=1 Tax=Anopheles nili TaxID=185578 RepID=UPI00237C39FE|nr:uncharacterized protein C2orf42 [Anopheles nili]
MSVQLSHRSTMRGLRKCPQCGTLNGNRTSKCKNETCHQALRDNCNQIIRSGSSFAVQLLPIERIRDAMYIVSLPNGVRCLLATTSLEENGPIAILSSTASRGTDIPDIETMSRMIVGCKLRAEALPILKGAIDSLAIPQDEKRALWEKRSQLNMCPLVQRVTSDLFVVGHRDTAYGVHQVMALKKSKKYSHFHCDCVSTMEKLGSVACWHIVAVAAGLLSAPAKIGNGLSSLLQNFVEHRGQDEWHSSYDVNSAFSYEYLLAGETISSENIEMQSILNPTIMEFFSDQEDAQLALGSPDMFNIDSHSVRSNDELAAGEATNALPPTANIYDLSAAGEESLHLMDCQIELMDEFDPTDRIDFCPSDVEGDDSSMIPASPSANPTVGQDATEASHKQKLVEITAKKCALELGDRVAKEKLTRGSYNVRKILNALESNGIILNRLRGLSDPLYEATLCSLSFTHWLESVIEQLNYVIDYNAAGKPDVQTFRIQEDFYRCLRTRFSRGHFRRQPEPTPSSSEIDRAPQVFKFTRPKALLDVFSTDRMELALEKFFVRSPDGQRFEEFLVDLPNGEDHRKAIRPSCYSTYIKFGRYKHEPDPEREYSFILEWTGDVLPRSKFGDLRISFEYGHRMNNKYLHPPPSLCAVE